MPQISYKMKTFSGAVAVAEILHINRNVFNELFPGLGWARTCLMTKIKC